MVSCAAWFLDGQDEAWTDSGKFAWLGTPTTGAEPVD